MTKILCVCAANLNRSPTMEMYFRKHMPQHEVRSAGMYYGYPYRVDEAILKWADKVLVMDISQEKFIAEHYPEYLEKVEVVGISDQYDRDSPELISLIQFWILRRKLFK